MRFSETIMINVELTFPHTQEWKNKFKFSVQQTKHLTWNHTKLTCYDHKTGRRKRIGYKAVICWWRSHFCPIPRSAWAGATFGLVAMEYLGLKNAEEKERAAGSTFCKGKWCGCSLASFPLEMSQNALNNRGLLELG